MALELNGTTGVSLVQNGVITDANLPAGSVLQVVQGTYATQILSTSGTYVDTGITASITPSSSANKVLVIASIVGVRKVNDTAIDFKIVRNSTDVQEFARFILDTSTTIQQTGVVAYTYLDSPASTSALAYKIQFKTSDGYVHVGSAGRSTITLMEIAG